MLKILYIRLTNGNVEQWENATFLVDDVGDLSVLHASGAGNPYAVYARGAWIATWMSDKMPRGFES